MNPTIHLPGSRPSACAQFRSLFWRTWWSLPGTVRAPLLRHWADPSGAIVVHLGGPRWNAAGRVWGLFYPDSGALWFDHEVLDWPERVAQSILGHELAHVHLWAKRQDYADEALVDYTATGWDFLSRATLEGWIVARQARRRGCAKGRVELMPF